MKKSRSKYVCIHYWLMKNYGKAKECKHCRTDKAKAYRWVLIKGEREKKDVKNYIQLCTKCLAKYKIRNKFNFPDRCFDGTKESKKKYDKEYRKIYYLREPVKKRRKEWGKIYRKKNKIKIKEYR